MLRSIKIRLYPNKYQSIQIKKLIGCYRFVYNQCLNRKINSYEQLGIKENRTTLSRFIHRELLKDDNLLWLREQNTHVLKEAMKDLLIAYENFFNKTCNHPKYKLKSDNKQSCRFDFKSISRKNIYTNYKISLANIKNIKFKCNKKYADYLQNNKDSIKHATLSYLPCGEYYLSVVVDGGLIHQVKETNNIIGIDLGIKDFVITSEGEVFNNFHFKKSETRKIKKLQKQLSRKQKGSNNRNKARIKLAKLYKKIDDKKQYYLHAVSNSLIDENQVICMEDLNVKGMIKNHKLAESICEMSFGEFRRMLEYKAKWYNRKIVFVDRFYPSSKTCNHCGYINKELTLNDRKWICPHCGEVISRDYNAALNILDEGMRIIGCSSPESKLVENPTMDEPIRNDLIKSSGSVKQEVNKASGESWC